MNKIRRHIVIGNWKLNGDIDFVDELLGRITTRWLGVHEAEVVVCPSFVHLQHVYNEYLAQSNIALGAQDVSGFEEGAYTGDVSADMLHDLGCQYAIVGHSERRRHYGESNARVAVKYSRVVAAQMTPILCVGETLEHRKKGKALDVIKAQIDAVAGHCGVDKLLSGIIAYEPEWAVGTGNIAEPSVIQDVHAFIREYIDEKASLLRIVYGGSVKPEKAQGLFAEPDIDGALVGGSALIADNFIEICRAAELVQT